MHETLSNISPKTSFFLGIGAMFILGFVVGFFVLLRMVLAGDTIAPVAQQPTQATGTQQPAAQQALANIAPITESDWIKGSKDAKVSIVEYSDTECPFCKRFHPTLQEVIDEYGDQVNWIYRHFPLESLHRKAKREAEATECAGELGGNDGFWAYLDRLFEVTPSNDGLQDSQLPIIAQDVGLDVGKFTECLDSGRHGDKVQSQVNDAVAAGGQGTPFSVIISPDGEQIPVSGAVPYEQIKSFLDAVL